MMRILLALALCVPIFSQSTAQSSFEAKVAGMTPYAGYFNFWWDAKGGRLLVAIDKFDTEFLYVNSLPAGVGSNDIGLDRGQLGQSRVVKFERSGPKVLLVQPNYGFRASGTDPYEKRSVEESFARSVLWGFTVEAEDASRVLIDVTPFCLRDAHGVASSLSRTRQGTWRVDATRSAIHLPKTKNFPKNTELDAMVTLTGENAGPFVREVVPSPDSITVRQHHSFIELPDAGFTPREFDPRAGYFGLSHYDFATPITEPLIKRFITRHRLIKKNPDAAISEVVKPITYYLDRGAPEPVRTALLDGARWWAQAFEAAGFRNAFRVELMPEDADPMDVRYNLIQWVHRSTRGWSYGSSVRDPRTGEILKGHVTLDSLRVRQDFLIAEGLLAPWEAGKPVDPKVMELCLARLRQLSAHEVGHTLGLSHNFASSMFNRASVMDYPHPLITLPGMEDAAPEVSSAYTNEIGEWDKVSIAWGYAPLDEPGLNKILDDAHKKGLYYITDADSRPEGGAHPASHLWDNGTDAAAELKRMIAVRERALKRFGERNIREGAPFATLEDALVPVYMGLRYQVEAAAKSIGGLDYRYALRGDGQRISKMVPAAQQRAALAAVVDTLKVGYLTLPERIIAMIPPRPTGYGATRELFTGRTGLTFDPIAAAEASANHTAGMLLHPERAARLVEYHARDASLPSLEDVIEAALVATAKAVPQPGLAGEVQRAASTVVLTHLMMLAVNDAVPVVVRAIAMSKLGEAQTAEVQRFLANPKEFKIDKPVAPPPGQPIGSEAECSIP